LEFGCSADSTDFEDTWNRSRTEQDFAYKIRALGVHINNESGMPAIAKSVAETLKVKFSTLPEFAERLGDDVTTLEKVG